MAGPDVRLIALTHVPTQGGLVNPAEAVGEVARRRDIPFLLDACQSAGQIDVNVARIGCDMLATTGRKFLRGPRGTGFLYVARRLAEQLDPPFIDMRAATWTAPQAFELAAGARRFETGRVRSLAISDSCAPCVMPGRSACRPSRRECQALPQCSARRSRTHPRSTPTTWAAGSAGS